MFSQVHNLTLWYHINIERENASRQPGLYRNYLTLYVLKKIEHTSIGAVLPTSWLKMCTNLFYPMCWNPDQSMVFRTFGSSTNNSVTNDSTTVLKYTCYISRRDWCMSPQWLLDDSKWCHWPRSFLVSMYTSTAVLKKTENHLSPSMLLNTKKHVFP